MRLKLAFLCMVVAAAAPAAFARELSLVAAQRLATERSALLSGQRLGIAAAREMAVAAGQLPDPVLTVGVENMPVEGPDRFTLNKDSMTMKRIALMQEITRREKRDLRTERQELEANRIEAEAEVLRATIHRDVAIAWLDAWYAQAAQQAVQVLRERAAAEVESADIGYRTGRGSQADVLMARGNLAMVDDRLAEQQRRVRTTRTLLARWTGMGDAVPSGMRPDISAVRPHVHELARSLENHPQIAVLRAQERIAAAEARLAGANSKPDWSVEFAYNARASAFGDMVSFGVSIPLPWDRAQRQDREVAAKRAMVGQAEATREETLRQHAAEYTTMLQEWEANLARLRRFTDQIAPLAGGRSEAAETAFRAGKGSLSDVLAARRAELDVQLVALQLEQETARLWAQLNFALPEAP
jgi:outer membrane protein TolC